MEAITIRPVDHGDWTLEHAGADGLQHFRSAAWAEAAATRLAQTFADAGRRATILVCKPDGAPSSRFVSVLR